MRLTSVPAKVVAAAACGALAVLVAVGCGSSDNGGATDVTTYGAPMAVGSGTARSFVTQRGNVPVNAGVEFTASAFKTLPQVPQGQAAQWALPFPSNLGILPYKDITLGYNEFGHEPVGNQDVAHMHVNFFTVDRAAQALITQNGPGADAPVDPSEIPPNHIDIHATVPGQGTIYFDPTLPGYTQHPFVTITYQSDFYAGHMTNLQLGVANSFVAGKQEAGEDMEQPQKFPAPGYYPTHYRFFYDRARDVYVMQVEDFVLRP